MKLIISLVLILSSLHSYGECERGNKEQAEQEALKILREKEIVGTNGKTTFLKNIELTSLYYPKDQEYKYFYIPFKGSFVEQGESEEKQVLGLLKLSPNCKKSYSGFSINIYSEAPGTEPAEKCPWFDEKAARQQAHRMLQKEEISDKFGNVSYLKDIKITSLYKKSHMDMFEMPFTAKFTGFAGQDDGTGKPQTYEVLGLFQVTPDCQLGYPGFSIKILKDN